MPQMHEKTDKNYQWFSIYLLTINIKNIFIEEIVLFCLLFLKEETEVQRGNLAWKRHTVGDTNSQED